MGNKFVISKTIHSDPQLKEWASNKNNKIGQTRTGAWDMLDELAGSGNTAVQLGKTFMQPHYLNASALYDKVHGVAEKQAAKKPITVDESDAIGRWNDLLKTGQIDIGLDK